MGKGKKEEPEPPEVNLADSDEEVEDEDLEPSEGTFVVEIIAARRLAKRYKKLDTSFPYCKLFFGMDEFVTETKEEELNPRWKATFEFDLRGERLEVDEVKFEVWCAKTKSLLGEVNLPVAGHRDTALKFAKEHWYPLSGGNQAVKRQEIVTNQSKKKKLDKKSDKALKFTGDLCVKMGLKVDQDAERKQVFAVTASRVVKIEDYKDADIEEMNMEAEVLAQESNAAAKRALNVAMQTRQIGAETLGKLDAQGQKLHNADRDLDQIHADLKEANRDLRSIHSTTGAMQNSLTSSKYNHVDRSKLSKQQRADLARQQREGKKGKKKKKGEKLTIEQILEQKKMEEEERNKGDTFMHLIESGQFDHLSADTQYHVRETEQTVDAIADTVGDLKIMAEEMSKTLDEQNALIDEMSHKTTVNNARLKKTRAKVRREF